MSGSHRTDASTRWEWGHTIRMSYPRASGGLVCLHGLIRTQQSHVRELGSEERNTKINMLKSTCALNTDQYNMCPSLWTVGGSWSTGRKPTPTRGEHANTTQDRPQLNITCCEATATNHCTTPTLLSYSIYCLNNILSCVLVVAVPKVPFTDISILFPIQEMN